MSVSRSEQLTTQHLDTVKSEAAAQVGLGAKIVLAAIPEWVWVLIIKVVIEVIARWFANRGESGAKQEIDAIMAGTPTRLLLAVDSGKVIQEDVE